MAEISEDLIVKILLLLPAVTLLRFRKHFLVPQLDLPDEVETLSWGFGYDSNSDDYKVPQVWFMAENCRFPYFSTDLEYPGVCVGDALHWKVKGPNRSYLIVAIHLGKLEYHLVPQPLITTNNFNLGVLDGCLYAIYENWTDDGFDLLVMKEYGV
ncbi:hypothetical protein DH2020_041258 [Rehmannia glutinosa]|uniref:F-box protein n=1 Tax=Rehmannia glutinosa TaxID=99300 RepID=A0ABR0UQP4_REHGL